MAGKKTKVAENTEVVETTPDANVEAQAKEMLDNAKEEAEKIVADAKEEAEKIVADAKASVSEETTEEQKQAVGTEQAYYDELVEIELFKDNGKYKDDVFVAVNGIGCLIQRGKRVRVKRKFANALEDSMNQDKKASDFIALKVRELEKAENRL